MIHYKLPWPPSLNRIWRVHKGRIILSAAARKFYRDAANALPRGRAPKPLADRLGVTLVLNPPFTVAGRFDIANREKLVMDALTKQRVWLDDSLIDQLMILRGSPAKVGSADIYIEVLP